VSTGHLLRLGARSGRSLARPRASLGLSLPLLLPAALRPVRRALTRLEELGHHRFVAWLSSVSLVRSHVPEIDIDDLLVVDLEVLGILVKGVVTLHLFLQSSMRLHPPRLWAHLVCKCKSVPHLLSCSPALTQLGGLLFRGGPVGSLVVPLEALCTSVGLGSLSGSSDCRSMPGHERNLTLLSRLARFASLLARCN
jgi:hypothetical protein